MIDRPRHASSGTSRDNRILLVASTFPSNERDGRPAFVLDLARALAQDHTVTALAPSIRGERDEQWTDIDVQRFSYFIGRWQGLADDAILPTLRREPWRWVEVPFFLAAMLWHTLRLSRRLKPQVVNAHWIIPGGLVAWAAKRLTGIPYVITVHGADVHGLDTTMGRAIKRRVLRGAERVVPVSEASRLALLDLDRGLAQRLTDPVPMGVSIPGELYESDRLAGEFLFIGRLAEKKGLITAVVAISNVEGAHLRVIGSGPEQERIRRAINELGLDDRVTLLGRLDRRSVFEHLCTCTGVIIPSIVASDGDQEGTPVVLAESAATGTPVIASGVAGLRENIVDGVNGLTFPPGDVSALADRIKWALDHPDEFRRMGEAALENFAGSSLDIATTGAKYYAVFDEVSAS